MMMTEQRRETSERDRLATDREKLPLQENAERERAILKKAAERE